MLLFFFNDTATTEIYTLSLHDALPILTLHHRQLVESLDIERLDVIGHSLGGMFAAEFAAICPHRTRRLVLVDAYGLWLDRKSTRLNSSHANISYAVFCLKKKKIIITSN